MTLIFRHLCLDKRKQADQCDHMKADAVTSSDAAPLGEDGHPSHPEHPAVLPRLTYTISDLWDGRISEAVREQWDALLLCLRQRDEDEPDEYQGLPRTEYNRIYDRANKEPAALRAAGPPDIQDTIARQVELAARPRRAERIEDEFDHPAIKKPNFGRLMTRGR